MGKKANEKAWHLFPDARPFSLVKVLKPLLIRFPSDNRAVG
jgi:hypothetical protein